MGNIVIWPSFMTSLNVSTLSYEGEERVSECHCVIRNFSDSKAVDKFDINRFIRNHNELLVHFQWTLIVLNLKPLQ